MADESSQVHLPAVVRRTSLVVVGLLAAVVALMLILAAGRTGVSIEGAVSDTHEVTGLRLLGIVSIVGISMWTATVAICAFAASVVRPEWPGGERMRSFLVFSSLVTLVLLVDDLLLVHEFADDVVIQFIDFDRTRQQKNLLETMVFGAYGLMFLWYCYRFRAELLAAPARRFFLAAAAMFALSFFFDVGGHSFVGVDLPDYRSNLDVESLAEEVPKFVGIAYYATFFALTARSILVCPDRASWFG